MNEEALNRLFILAENDGYKKSFEEFKVLMSSNEDAINTMYGLAKGDGYSKDINEFKTLVGFDQSVKKKDETLPQPGQPSEVIGQPSTGTPAMESGLTLQSPTSTELVSPLDGSTLASEEEQRRKQSSDYQSMISMAAGQVEEDDDKYKVKAIGKKAAAPRPNISLEEYADVSVKLPVYKYKEGEYDPNKVFKPEQSYPQGVISAADKLGMTPEDYLDVDKRLKRQEEIRADEKAIEDINREKKNLEIENAYVKNISKTYGINEDEVKNNLSFFALKNTFSDPEGRYLMLDSVDGLESFDPDDVLNLRQQLAEKAINTSGIDLKQKAFEKIINKNDGDVVSSEKVFDQGMEDIGYMFLNDQEKEIKKLKESILILESNPNITPEEKRKLETKKEELTKFMREGLLGYTQLFDPSTGKFVSSDEASEEVISFNNKVNNKIKSYENTDLGKLKKHRDDVYFSYQAFVLDFMLDQKPTGLSPLAIEAFANRYGIDTYDERTGRYKSTTELLNMFTKEQKKEMALEEYKDPFNFHGWDLGGAGDMSQAFKIMNSDIFPDDVTKKAQEILADYMSVNRIINLNEDPGSVQESYGGGRVLTYGGKALKESIGVAPQNVEFVADRAIENIKKAGFDLTLQQQDAIKQDMPQKVGEAIGGSIVPMAEIMVNLALLNKAAGAAKIPKLIETISGGNKIAKFGLDLTYEMASQGAAFEMAGQEFVGGAGEGFGQFLVDAALKKLNIDNRVLSVISKSVGGALSETAAEYTGQFVDELSKKNIGFDKAVERTFGKTPEDAMEKFALTYLVSQIYGLGTSTVSTLTSPLTYKKSDSEQEISNEQWSDWASKQVISFDSDSPIVNEIKKFAEDQQAQSSPVQKTEIESILDFEEKKLSPEDKIEAPEATVKRAERISELNSLLASDAASLQETGMGNLIPEARQEVQQELETLKSEQDAIQEQTAGQVPVQPETAVSETVEEGTPEAEPQVVTEKGKQEAVAKQYADDLKETKDSDPEQYWSVDSVSEEVAKEGTIITDEDGGVVVSKEGDIKGLFKRLSSKAKGVAQKLLQKAIDSGGNKLDNFDTYLTPIYKKAGFRVVSRIPFNEEYAPDGWNKEKHGTPDVVAMVYDPNNELDIEERTFDDYDEAMAYRDSYVEQARAQTQEEIDLESQLAEDLDIIKSEVKPRFRVEGVDIPAEEDINLETIESNLDKLPTYEVNFTTPEVSQDIQVNPIEESKSSTKEDRAFRNAKVTMEPTDVELLSAKLRFAFPDVTVSNTKEEFDRILQEEGVRTKESDGKVILGMTKDGKVYLNPESDSLATPIHEFGHIWIDFLRSEASGKRGNDLLSKGLSLVEGTTALQQAISKYGDNNLAREEALVELMATKGETIINKSKEKQFKNWLNALFKYVKKYFTTTEQLFKDKQFKKALEDMSLDDFINIGLADLLKGRAVSSDFKAKDAGKSAAELRFRVSDNIQSFINKARAQGFSEVAIKNVLTKSGVDVDVIDTALSKTEPAAKKVEVTNEFAPGYDRVLSQIAGIVEKSRKRGRSETETMNNAIEYLKGTKVYEAATDVQGEAMVRNVRKEFKKREKSAPSAKRILGQKKDVVTVTVDLAKERDRIIKEQIKLAKEVTGDLNEKRAALATSINEILMKFDKDVTIRNKKFKAISNRINKTNLDNEVSVEKLLNYIEKTFVDAEYGLKLSTANKNATSIRKEIKRKRKDPVLLSSAKSFLLIDPSLVDDIDAYLEISNKITNGLRPTSITDTKTNVSQGFIVSDVDAYTEEALEIQDEKLSDALDKQIDQITELEIKAKEEMTKTNIKEVFDYYSLLAKQMVTTNKDYFTGDDIDIDPETKTLIDRLINVDPLSIKKEDAIKAIEAINNFLVNQSTSNMQSIVSKFEGVENARKEVNKGTKSRDLRLFFGKGFGRVIGQYFTGLPLIFEKIFGKTPGLRIMRAMGFTDIIQGKSKAIKTIQGILNSYNDTFLKTKPNGESFNTSYNITERGMVAFMRRHIPGSDQVDFNKRKSLIKQSIDELKSNGDKDQVKKAEIYEEVYNKILKGVNNIKQLESKVDKTNLEAVDWWTKEWSKHYDQLSIVNREVYNEILDKDNNYTPDVFSSIGDVEVDLDRSSFFNTSNYVNKKKTGSLIQSTRPSKLTKGRYVNLDFDFNNANALLGALQDINTASSIMKLDGFLNSDAFKNLIKSNDDRRLLVDRINAYINDMKGSNMYSYDELKNVAKAINFVSSVGVSKALGGGAQVLKQTIPVALNTMINAGQINLLATTNPSYISWLDKVGSGVSIRGLESTADVERLNSLIERAADSKFEVATKYIKKANDLWLNIFLKNPDVWIAKSSFQAYYKQSLKRQGLEYKNIDWDTHEANQEAVDYAQNQVDRQQNFSDVALQGKLFTDKNQVLQLVRKIVFPFAGFRMNQKSRMYSDFINLWRGDSSKQDRIDSVRSLGGLAVEQVAFLTIGALIKTLITSIAYSWIGENEDEEDRKKRIDQYLKGAKSNATLDLLSPIPQTDFLITGGYNKLIDVFQKDLPEDERGYIYDQEGRPREVLDDLGTIGIAAKEVDALLEMSGMAYDGKYTTEYFGIKKEKKIDDKSDMTLPAIFQALYIAGVLPKDFSDFAKFTTKAIKNEKTK